MESSKRPFSYLESDARSDLPLPLEEGVATAEADETPRASTESAPAKKLENFMLPDSRARSSSSPRGESWSGRGAYSRDTYIQNARGNRLCSKNASRASIIGQVIGKSLSVAHVVPGRSGVSHSDLEGGFAGPGPHACPRLPARRDHIPELTSTGLATVVPVPTHSAAPSSSGSAQAHWIRGRTYYPSSLVSPKHECVGK